MDIFNLFKGTAPFTCTGINAPQTIVADDVYADANAPWLVGANVAPNSSNVYFRCPRNYERLEMPPDYSGRSFIQPTPTALGPTSQLRFEAWLMRGVIRENDVANGFYSSEERPDVDPWNDQSRVFNHFYSPVTNSPDSPSTVALGGGPSLHWAMGEVNPFANTQVPNPTRGNHFSYMDARRAFYFALTYKQNPSTPDKAFEDSRVRMALWATTLKSIGHVVHLMQNQASPQHSRGEPHNHVCKGPGVLANQDLATRTYEILSIFD